MGAPSTHAAESPAALYDRAFVPAVMEPFIDQMLRVASPAAGERVLDIACGTGALLRRIGPLLGGAGAATGLDLSPEMLAVARARSPKELAIEWVEGSALSLPFADHSFDLVLCNHGLQFFPDRPLALREMRRVLAPSGRLVIAVFCSLEKSPLFAAINASLEAHFGTPALARPFSIGDPAQLETLVEGAGVEEVEISTHQGVARFPSLRAGIETVFIAVRPYLPAFAELDESARAALITAIVAEVEPKVARFIDRGALVAPNEVNIARARAPVTAPTRASLSTPERSRAPRFEPFREEMLGVASIRRADRVLEVEPHTGLAALASRSFDLVLVDQTLPHLPDRDAALGETRRLLDAGGRLVIAAFSSLEHNPVFRAIDEALAENLGTPALERSFSRAPREDLERALRRAGFDEIESRTLRRNIPFASLAECVASVLDAWSRYVPALARLDGVTRASLESSIVEDVEPTVATFMSGASLAAPCEAHLVRARVPRLAEQRRIVFKLPGAVRDTWDEAVKCEQAGAHLATAMLVERGLQLVVRELEPTAEETFAGLDVIAKRGIISGELRLWADQLSLSADTYVRRPDARDALDFLQALLEAIYRHRPRFLELQARRASAIHPGALTHEEEIG